MTRFFVEMRLTLLTSCKSSLGIMSDIHEQENVFVTVTVQLNWSFKRKIVAAKDSKRRENSLQCHFRLFSKANSHTTRENILQMSTTCLIMYVYCYFNKTMSKEMALIWWWQSFAFSKLAIHGRVLFWWFFHILYKFDSTSLVT